MLKRLAACALLVMSPGVRAAEPGLTQWLKEFHQRAEEKPGERQSRELTFAALAVLTNGDEPALAEEYVRRAYDTQDMDHAAKTYGELRWLVGDAPPITDFNAIEFNSIQLGPILNGYRDKLSPDFETYLKPHVQASLDAMRAHKVKVSYTNICLMNAESLILLGQAAQDDAAIKEGTQRLDTWIDYTKKSGIHEFDSPTYYGVDLYALMKAYRYTTDATTKAEFKTILDYFWTDIAANYFEPGHRLAGPYARDYDFLAGTGMLDDWLKCVGWESGIPTVTVAAVDNFGGAVYQPPGAAAALAQSGPRMVISRWDENPAHLRYAWLGKSISMGCTSGSYEAQDKLFAATFAGPRDMPQITLVVDTFDSPFGLVKQKDRTNHSKPWHQEPNFASTQIGETALITMDIDPSKTPSDANGLATNLVLPANASITIDGAPADLSSPRQIDVKPDSIISASANGGAFAMRLLRVDPLDGRAPEITLASDVLGLSHHAVRLKIAHLPSGQSSQAKHLHMSFLATVADSDQANPLVALLRGASVKDELHDGIWHVEATCGDAVLDVKRSASDARTLFPSSDQIPPGPLSVNHTDLAARIWQSK